MPGLDDLGTTFVNDKGEPVQFVGEDHGNEGSESEVETSLPADDREKYVTLEVICELGWEQHRAWETIIGEQPKLPWEELPESRQEEIKNGVMYIINHPTAPVKAQHDYWRAHMAGAGKDHKNMVEFDKLPWSQQRKAVLWRHTVHAILG